MQKDNEVPTKGAQKTDIIYVIFSMQYTVIAKPQNVTYNANSCKKSHFCKTQRSVHMSRE